MSRSQVLMSVLFAVLASSTFAGAAAVHVDIGGSVTSTLDVTATLSTGGDALDLTVGTQRIAQVADVTMTTNNAQGISLSIDSGSLVKTSGANSTPITFQVATVADGTTAPIAAAFTSLTTVAYTAGSTSAAGSTPKDLYIMYSPAAVQDPGDYGARITLTFSDN